MQTNTKLENDSEQPPFARTVCACKECVQCCKRQPGSLIPGDFERIAEFLGETSEEAQLHFWASPGGAAQVKVTGEIIKVGTITPRRVDGRCVFLDENDRCKIHTVAPAGCAYFDTHLSFKEGQKRSVWVFVRQMANRYQQLRAKLQIATSYKPTVY